MFTFHSLRMQHIRQCGCSLNLIFVCALLNRCRCVLRRLGHGCAIEFAV